MSVLQGRSKDNPLRTRYHLAFISFNSMTGTPGGFYLAVLKAFLPPLGRVSGFIVLY